MTQVSTEEKTGEISIERQNVIGTAIDQIIHIATLPEVTIKIIELVENPDATAQDLHKIISNDPALSARVLKVVNSAFYALPGQIASINRAIVLLGLNAVKNIAIAASLAKLFRGGRLSSEFEAKDLWKHSIAVGTGVRLLAERLDMGLPDEAFLAGLIHDIGIMVEMQTNRSKLIEVVESVKEGKSSFLEAEEGIIGATHEEFGYALCTKWKFPANLANVTGYHHRPLELDAEVRTLSGLVNVADILAGQGEAGYSGTVKGVEIDRSVFDELKLTEDIIEEVSEKLPEAAETADALLGGE